MATCERALDIEATPQRIWDFLADFRNWEKIMAGGGWLSRAPYHFSLAENSAPGENAVVLARLGKRKKSLAWTIREWIPLKKITLSAQSQGGWVGYTAAMAFAIEPKTSLTTQVSFRCDFETGNLLLQPLLGLSWSRRSAAARVLETIEQLRASLRS